MAEAQSTDEQTLVWKLSHVNAFALPEREAEALVALCMRAARVISDATILMEQSMDIIEDWPETDPEHDLKTLKGLRKIVAEIRNA